MRSIRRWAGVVVMGLAGLAGGFIFSQSPQRDASARESARREDAKWQISSVSLGESHYCVFMVNQSTGEVYKHDSQSGGFAKIAGPIK